jgi:hypothetical protein
MKKIIIICLFISLSTGLFAEISAVLDEVSGKVEIKAPGESWQKAEPGMIISKGYLISTGFKAEAVLKIGPSKLIVKQLTRMELEELVEKEGTISTGLNLRVGKIKAEVRTTAGLRQNFRLTSPVSTAAVRGTSFEYDGVNLKVFEGTVAFTNRRGQTRSINMGEASKITGFSLPGTAEDAADALAAVIPSTMTAPDIVKIFEDLTNITIILDWGI